MNEELVYDRGDKLDLLDVHGVSHEEVENRNEPRMTCLICPYYSSLGI